MIEITLPVTRNGEDFEVTVQARFDVGEPSDRESPGVMPHFYDIETLHEGEDFDLTPEEHDVAIKRLYMELDAMLNDY